MGKDNVIEIKYPHPHFRPQAEYSDEIDEEGAIDSDVGYLEGVFSDERPYRVECWAIDDVRMATIYFSDRNLKKMTKEDLANYLEAEKLVVWLQHQKSLHCKHVKDEIDISMWAVNIKLKDEQGSYAEITGKLKLYDEEEIKS